MRFFRFSIAALFALGAVAVAQAAHAAALVGSFAPLSAATAINLTAEGALDWAHWGLVSTNSLDHKNLVTNQIGSFTLLGTNVVQQTGGITVNYSWTDGTPTTNANNSATALLVIGLGDGFQFQVPADTTLKRLKVYLGATLAQGGLLAHLSDLSAPDYSDVSLTNSSGDTDGVYTLDFAAGSTGRTLTVSFTLNTPYDPVSGSVLLESATLQPGPTNPPPTATLISPANELNFLTNTSITLTAQATVYAGSVRKVEFYADSVRLGTATNFPYSFAWTNAAPGFHSLTAVATDSYGATGTSPVVSVYVYTGQGTVTASVATPPATTDLTAEGTSDWAHWGMVTAGSFDHKAGVAQQISDYSIVGSGPAYPFGDNASGYDWSDGTPSAAATNTTTGVYLVNLGNGFQISAPAGTSTNTLNLYVGTFGARGKLRTWLSDNSAAAAYDRSLENFGNGPNVVYSLQYRASAPGKSVIVQYTVDKMDDFYGNVTLQAATLVTPNLPPYAAITNPPNNAVFPTNVPAAIDVNAYDLDGTITNVAFFDTTNGLTALIGQMTSGPYHFVRTNFAPGAHQFTARATDDGGATFTSTPIGVYVIVGGGLLLGSVAAPPTNVNLSYEGQTDWAHWGLSSANSFDDAHQATVRISNKTILGKGSATQFGDNAVGFDWTNGSQPNVVVSNTTTGIYMAGLSNGFQFTVPADTTRRRLRVYVGLYGAVGRFDASLSDFSAAAYSDTSLSSVYGNAYGVYTLDYFAASPNQALTLTYTLPIAYDDQYGNVSLESASLSLVPASNPILLRNLLGATNGFRFSFATEPGISYTVQYATAPNPTNWLALTNRPGSGGEMFITNATSLPPLRLYRVRSP